MLKLQVSTPGSCYLAKVTGVKITVAQQARIIEIYRNVKLMLLKIVNFDVLLTVHLSIILVLNQLNAQILVL